MLKFCSNKTSCSRLGDLLTTVAFILNFFFFWFLVSNACLVSHVRSGGNYLGATKMPNQVKVLPRTKTWQRQLQYNNRNQPQTILTSKQFYTCQLVVHSCCYCRFYTKLEICLWTQGKKYETHIHREEKHEHRKKKVGHTKQMFFSYTFFFFVFFCFFVFGIYIKRGKYFYGLRLLIYFTECLTRPLRIFCAD